MKYLYPLPNVHCFKVLEKHDEVILFISLSFFPKSGLFEFDDLDYFKLLRLIEKDWLICHLNF